MNTAKDISAKSEVTPVRDECGLSLIGIYELTKPRLSLLSVFTTSLGFLVHDPLRADLALFLCLTAGTALAAGGAAALNQWMERREDALMARTSGRPIPAKLVSPEFAFGFGLFLSMTGLAILYLGTNLWASLLTLATLVVYLLFYTPLKKKSPLAIEIGAISGALPPLIGWVAAAGSPTLYGWILFGILFAWQLPHFMAIAWNFRDDYEKGGFRLHDLGEQTGFLLARKSFLYTIFLHLCVFAPFLLKINQEAPGQFYFFSAIALSTYIMFKAHGFLFTANRDQAAKRLFVATIIYLPLLLAALVIDRYL